MSVLTLTEAKDHLNITAATYDAEIQSFTASAEAVIGRRCGLLTPTPVARRVKGGPALMLPMIPVVSLTSVTPVGGSALTLADLYLNTASGVVTYNLSRDFGEPFYDVAYQSGWVTVPEDLLYAVKELVRHFWTSSQRGGSRRPGSEPMAVNPASYLLPYAVQSLIEPYIQPGFF